MPPVPPVPGGASRGRLGFVGAPGAAGEVPEQAGQGGRDEGAEREASPGPAPPAAGSQEAEPGTGGRAGGVARALPGEEVQRDLAGRRDEQHGEAEGEDPHEEPVRTHRHPAGRGCGPGPVGEVDHHEGQEQQPQGAGPVAGGEPGPAVGLEHGPAGVTPGVCLGVGVLGAPEHGGGGVTGDPDGVRIAEQLPGGGSADSVDEEFEGQRRRARRGGSGRGEGIRHGGLRRWGAGSRGSPTSIPPHGTAAQAPCA